MDEGDGFLLRLLLQVSVPLWIEELRPLSDEERASIAREMAPIIAEHGDEILYRSKKKGNTAKYFNALSRAIAAAAFAPGGVKILGLHFEANRSS